MPQVREQEQNLVVTHGYILNPREYQEFKRYEEIRGVPINTAIEDALAEYIYCCIHPRLETATKRLHLA